MNANIDRNAPIFAPIKIGHVSFRNRIFRSSISGRIDNYNGSGTPARVRFEERFAAGGVGAIISSHVPIRIDSRILPNYATIDQDARIPFWTEVGKRVHSHNCKYILQLSMSGRQQDIGGIENFRDILNIKRRVPPSSTDQEDAFNGLPSRSMNKAEIADAIEDFADAAYRAFQAGLDGLELHSSNGYLINQFLSSAINQRGESDYGGEIGDPSIPGAKEGRARFVCDIIRAIREKLPEMFLSMKLSVVELDNATRVWPFHHFFPKGNSIEESIRIAKWVEKAGASAIHVSTGSMFPHPRNPAGPFPLDMAWHPFQSVVSSGRKSFALFYGMRFLGRLLPLFPALRQLLRLSWARTQADFLDGAGRPIPSKIEGLNLSEAAIIKKHVSIPVICTGGFQTAEGILRALRTESCDIVSIARGLLANPTLPNWLQAGNAGPERPCSYCNRCLVSVLEHPLGCYDLDRFDGDYDKMIDEVMSIFPDKTPDEWAPAIT